MEEMVEKVFTESIRVQEEFYKRNSRQIIECAEIIAEGIRAGGKLMLIGNGGSAADCQHVAAEFINRFLFDRNPLPALALTTDTSNITSIGNDYSFDDIFYKQVKALGKREDILMAFSTSGNSRNVIRGVEAAKEMGIKTISLTGKGGGALAGLADMPIKVNSGSTPRIQEAHITICHAVCELVEHMIFQRA